MKHYHRHIIFSLLTIFVAGFSFSTHAQERWRTHLSYANVSAITQTPDKIFGLSSGSMFSYDKGSSTEIYSKPTGLSDNNILYINYSDADEMLLIAYKNSNVDLMTKGGAIYNMPDLYRKSMTGSKTISHAYFNKGSAYLSTDFGIAKVNLRKKEFSDTYIIGENGTNVSVKAVTIWNDSIYAATDTKIYAANLTKNLSNFQNWTSTKLPSGDTIQTILTFGNRLFMLKSSDKTVYVRADQSADEWAVFAEDISYMKMSQYRLTLNKPDEIISYSTPASPVSLKTSFTFSMGLYDNDGYFYTASYVIQKVDGYGNIQSYSRPDGPIYNDPFAMKFMHDKLYVLTSGAHISGSFNQFIPGGVMIYDGNSWLNIENWNIPDEHRDFQSLMSIAVDPSDASHFYVGSFSKGLYEFRNNTFYQRFNSFNSAIQPYTDPTQVDKLQIIAGLTFDKDGNLWMNQSVVSNAIKVLKKDGSWKSFYFPSYINRSSMHQTLIDNNNFKWICQTREGSGLLVFNDKGTLNSASDIIYVSNDAYRFRTSFTDQDNGSFSPATFQCMALDKKEPQKMWVGTSEGPVIIPNTQKAFDADFKISRIKIPRNDGTNLADYLLGNEHINTIVVDGANRKWLGTRTSGVYLVSEDGTETIHHFTTENSPLLSNNVLSVGIDAQTGEVFFGTDQGIVAFIGDATEPVSKFETVYAYPNPVREDYNGLISIVGLMENTNVKITDVAGNIIYETTSNGGMAIWDGTNINGHRVKTGVYLAMCSSEDGKESSVCKILVIGRK